MSIDVYYFSGTGNSLSVAREISRTLNGNLVSISSFLHIDSVHSSSSSIAIVFPAYLAQKFGVPSVVTDFIKKIADIRSKRVFAICTCGGFEIVNAVPTLRNLAKTLNKIGGKLFAEFPIKLPMNNLTYPSQLIGQDFDFMFSESAKRIVDICTRIEKGRANKDRIRNILLNWILSPVYFLLQNFYVDHVRKMAKEPKASKLDYFELIKLTDRSISIEASCNGCGICSKVCPVGNITLEASRPVFMHHCEMCLACDEWCPSRSIRHWCKTAGKNYRHPSVRLSDMLDQATKTNLTLIST